MGRKKKRCQNAVDNRYFRSDECEALGRSHRAMKEKARGNWAHLTFRLPTHRRYCCTMRRGSNVSEKWINGQYAMGMKYKEYEQLHAVDVVIKGVERTSGSPMAAEIVEARVLAKVRGLVF